MNGATISGKVVSAPILHRCRLVAKAEFDLDVPAPCGDRIDRFHVVAGRDLAAAVGDVRQGDPIAVTGYLRSEPFDMPDRTVWYRVELVARVLTRL